MTFGSRYVPSREIRDTFIKFMEDNGHLNIGPSSIIPKNDPTLLFINSGMAALKDYFTGDRQPPNPDMVNFQPCIRTGDIDDIGDRHHLSFFEMLGSWSIDNYFKQRAIELAYGLLVDKFGFPPERLYATVYGGNEKLGLPADTESIDAWIGVGIPRERIVVLGEDNFWMAGDVGPCGPCTEVFFDTGEEFGPTYEPGGHFDDKSRYIEIWNAGVFMEFNRQADGSFSKLPFTSVDTGSGLERMEMAMNGHGSAYETDLMKPQMDYIASQFGAAKTDAEVRVHRQITDHMRSTTFMLGEGVTFGNEGRSYIPRRLARKVIALVTMHARDPEAFDYAGLISQVVKTIGNAYPFLNEREDQIITTFNREVKDFRRVIDKGLVLLEGKAGKGSFKLSGSDAFELFATYGMPKDLIKEFVAERGGSMDETDFDKQFKKHQEVSRAAGTGTDSVGVKERTDKYLGLFKEHGVEPTTFTGYNDADYTDLSTHGEVKLILREGLATDSAKEGDVIELIADRTPFYGEGGGQVGDTGTISHDHAKLTVTDTQKIEGHFIHFAEVTSGEVKVGERVQLKVNSKRRQRIANNHTATHLLQSALIAVLGDHIRQKGSIVTPDYLRFDFSHPQKVTAVELKKIEQHVNAAIRANAPQSCNNMTYTDAMKAGAIAFTGDKYGDEVRVISYGERGQTHTVELCGGTHVARTGDIGFFKIMSESSVASGIRRIQAAAGEPALALVQEQEELLLTAANKLKSAPAELVDRIEQLQKKESKAEAPKFDLSSVKQASKDVGGVPTAFIKTNLPAGSLRENAIQAADHISGVVCLASDDDGKASLVVAVAQPLLNQFNARNLLQQLLPLVDGKGGGKDRFAQGGGAKIAGLADAPAALEQGVLAGKAAA